MVHEGGVDTDSAKNMPVFEGAIKARYCVHGRVALRREKGHENS